LPNGLSRGIHNHVESIAWLAGYFATLA